MGKKVALHNLGCKVNAYEVEAMQQLLEEAGYEIVPFEPGADVYLINTCTVTNIADRKSRQMLHKAKKMNPDAIVIAAGCYVQTDEGKLDKDEAVDLILGNNQKGNIVQVLEERLGALAAGAYHVPYHGDGDLALGGQYFPCLCRNHVGILGQGNKVVREQHHLSLGG